MNDLSKLIIRILDKLMSARYMAFMIIVIFTCVMAYNGRFPMEAFTGLSVLVIRDYFNRADRGKDNGLQGSGQK